MHGAPLARFRDSAYRASESSVCSEAVSKSLLSKRPVNPVSIQSLPVELIIEIFTQCFPPDDIRQHTPVDCFKAPLLLCQICSTWRNIAFSAPQLWDTLSLQFFGDVSSSVLSNALNLTRLWFGNAQDLPLHFSIDLYDAEGDDYCDLEFTLLSYSTQFRHLDLRTRSEHDLARFLSLPPGHLASLECLHFVTGTLDDDSCPITVFSSAPRLQRAFISVDDGWPPNSDIPTRILLPWAQLTHLEIGARLGYVAWASIFSQCPLLEYCDVSFDFSDVADPSAAPRHPLVVPRLLDMSITDVSNADPSHFQLHDLDVTFPMLEAYEIRHCLINLDWIEGFARPLRYHSLRRLSLHRNPISIDDLLFFLRATVSLVELSLWLNISKHVDHRRLWDALSYRGTGDGAGYLLVNLEIFDLWMWIYEGDFYPLECARMVESRWAVQALEEVDSGVVFRSLRRVSMHLHPDQGRVKSMSNLLEPYKIEGLDVSVDSRQYMESRSKQW